MSRTAVVPIGREVTFDEDEIIVSKTDLKGRITYCNDVFIRVAGYDEDDLLGAPHSIIRHPDMPRTVFKLLWDTLGEGKEIFAYVVNLSRDGRHYWVLAHVTPSYDEAGRLVGYHSNRRVPNRKSVAAVEPLYRKLRELEESEPNRRDGMAKAAAYLNDVLTKAGVPYDEFVQTL